VYQTLDLKERAWHAGEVNDFSVGIEIANIGAYADSETLDRWYTADEQGMRVTLPEDWGDGGLPPGYIARPRRSEPVRGEINGRKLVQYDFTEEQYQALEKLLVSLCRIFPRLRAGTPRDEEGNLLKRAFSSEEELLAFEGLLGHWHVTRGKVDPGPAFDWDRVLAALRESGVSAGGD
jgi:N-acetyl-anhydromuramyl-L-alanine amidase AmpD